MAQTYNPVEVSAEALSTPGAMGAALRCFAHDKLLHLHSFSVGSADGFLYSDHSHTQGVLLFEVLKACNAAGIRLEFEAYTEATTANMTVVAYIGHGYACYRVVTTEDGKVYASSWKTIPLRWFKAIYGLWLYGEDDNTSMLYPTIEEYLPVGDKFRCIP